jgi:hypothetical protein
LLSAVDEAAEIHRSDRFLGHDVALPYALAPNPMCVSRSVRRT